MWRLSYNAVHHGLQLPQQLVALLWCDWNRVQVEEHVVPVQLDAGMTSHIICLCGGCVKQAPVAPIRMRCEGKLQQWEDQRAKVVMINSPAEVQLMLSQDTTAAMQQAVNSTVRMYVCFAAG